MERINQYTPTDASDDTVRIITAFLEHLPPDGKANLTSDLESLKTDNQIRLHAKSLFRYLLVIMRLYRGIGVSYPRNGTEDSTDDCEDEKLKKECLERDGNKCTITGILDGDSRRPNDSGTRVVHTECAYIIPSPLGKREHDHRNKAIIWNTLNKYFPSLQELDFNQESIHEHRNVIIMWREVHRLFRMLVFALEETDIEHTYRVKSYDPEWTWLIPSDRITFQSNNQFEPPSPGLLRIHASIAGILNESGKAREIQNLLW